MQRILLLFLVLLYSCNNTRTESWYQTDLDSLPSNRNLVKQIFYDTKGRIEKLVLYRPSETLYQKETIFNDKGLKTTEITYYDSARLNGIKTFYKYDGKILVEQSINNIEDGKIKDTSVIVHSNILDNLN